jgi:hypothetical protein
VIICVGMPQLQHRKIEFASTCTCHVHCTCCWRRYRSCVPRRVIAHQRSARWVQSSTLKFMWKDGSKWLKNGRGFFGGLIIYNLASGISRVEQDVSGTWTALKRTSALGQMWKAAKPGNYKTYGAAANRKIKFQIYDIDGNSYGAYEVLFECSETAACATSIDARATKL